MQQNTNTTMLLTFIRSGRGIADIRAHSNYTSTPVAKLLAGSLKIDVDPNLNNAQLVEMREQIDVKIMRWRILNMGKMRDNFGFSAAQAERRAQRILSA